jgi:MFS family permease
MQATHDPYAALRLGDYRRVLSGSVLAALGTEMQAVAVGWELYQRTGSAAALGLVGLVQFLPVLFLSLPAGHAADRYSRRILVAVALAVMASASLGLSALSLGQGPIPLVYLCLLVAGISRAFSSPARWSLVPQIVPPEILSNAVTWNSSGWQIASVAGPAIGGLVIAATGRAAGAYLGTAACCLAAAALIGSVRPRVAERRLTAATWHSLLAGIRFVWNTKLILATITLDLFAVLLGGATALLPIYARDILQVGPSGLGWLRAAPSLGALIMAIGLAHRPPFQRAGRTLLVAVAGFGVATVIFGLSENFALSFAMLATTGALDNISIVVRGTLVQGLTPDEMRGRVSAVNAVFIGSSNELGAFESGATAALFGPVISVVGGGIGTILVVLLVMLKWPQVYRLGPLHPREEMSPALTEVAHPDGSPQSHRAHREEQNTASEAGRSE